MPTFVSSFRWMVLCSVAVAVVAVGCKSGGSSNLSLTPSASVVARTPVHCGPTPPAAGLDGWQPVPKNASIECLREVAGMQHPGTTVQQTNVPATTTGCEVAGGAPGTTQIDVTAYKGIGAFDFDGRYQANDGYVIAIVQNSSACTTKPKFSLAAGHSYFWVVEKKEARLVDVQDGTSLKLGRFQSCTKEGYGPTMPEPPKDIAMIKSNSIAKKCNHDQKPEALVGFAVRDTANYGFLKAALDRLGVLAQIENVYALWISCGGDCCFSDF